MFLDLLVFAALSLQPGGSLGVPPCKARLGLTRDADMLTLTGHCHSLLNQPGRYRYQLVVQRHSPRGRSQNTQSGEFDLPAQQEAVLSSVRLNATPQDVYRATLFVFDLSGRTVAQDSIVQTGSPR